MLQKFLLLSLFGFGISFAAEQKSAVQQPEIDHDGFVVPLPPQRFVPTPTRDLTGPLPAIRGSKFVYTFGTNPLTSGTLYYIKNNHATVTTFALLNEKLKRAH